MKFDPPLTQGTLVKRYKRFLADIVLQDGTELTVHCPNTGSMKNCNEAGSTVWISDSGNPKRKYRHTWELVSVGNGAIAGINTGRANGLVREAIAAGQVPELDGYDVIRSEVKYGAENSRIDLLLESAAARCFVEIKNLTLGEGDIGYFPDAVTERGRKHLRELEAMVQQGHRAVLFFCVQHSGVTVARPADHIDPKYGAALRQAHAAGVEVMAWQCDLSAQEIVIARPLPVQL
ncbi:MAG: DNA/RNA nuclease SfsA [Pseudomonadales bacterium]|jgi:sugar fermentation stimulation protein A|uniref:DNA/RNA nuclease SfsA n=1 Tax=unclassified Ketobacter TaxID=2639109 RepID=UPI000C5BBC79|nr:MULTISPECIES: DNA/RNA nuclease SfsA [unclassified Ketobacter]MAQ24343.1 DNA/RNA nuclease SfsA [Pseudomonadales bacterium]MEC8813725.1 DNA/RNA nuclease SfsA [Pseudomonadota bacterium]HAU14820.1 DNA/RNA nuclease SfsA [Gammaproteobacteria bacterium]MBI25565.1 DNA/RNA nuclease SfsA [Pseudomonadales bacterium]RLT91061.1 MAG: DNA/RNA nuclease SfsA [Ketobacter sp. GenoA1]|tara:strand:- start:2435 stop:3136 length:702 start_codon:yes stop_codon:yes gene_type:complete